MRQGTARIALYARFSSDLQDERSLADQLALCRERASKDGGDVVAVYQDAAISGAALANRPGILQLLADAKAGRFDVVMAEALDRLSRGQSDMPRLLERLTFNGVKIVTLAEGEITELHVGLMGTMNALLLKQIAAKVKRGQLGRVREGRIPGGHCYGYTIAGKGERTIDKSEAAIVRRIFADYASGRTAFEIAAALNSAHITAPRGGEWNASTINGSRSRANGILNNELYAGRIVYNRQSFRKDPDTGRRIARVNAQADWISMDVPALRIVDEGLWQAVRARKREMTAVRPERQMRPPRLLSGLLRCACCGGSYTIVRKNIIGCSTHREKGTCANAKLASLDLIESRVLTALRVHLLAPEVVAAAVRVYHDEAKRLAANQRQELGALEREQGEISRKMARIVTAIEDGAGDAGALVTRLRTLEARHGEIAALLAEFGANPVIEIHPKAADQYRRKVETIRDAFETGDEDMRREGMAAVRSLIARVTVIPTPKRQPVGLEVVGELAALIAENNQGPKGRGAMVAGVGFEPTTFRL